jgi:hypothetical protein
MFRSLVPSLFVALLGALVIALPGFALKVEASETAVLAKGDRLQVRSADMPCSNEIWPNLSARCLQSSSGGKIQEARLVTARR